MEMNRPFYSGQVKTLIRVIYVRDARMIIAVNCDLDGLTNEASQLFTFDKGLISNCYPVAYTVSCRHPSIVSTNVLALDLLAPLATSIQKI